MRGEIVKLAGEIKTKLEKGEKFPFDKVVMCNIGNPQALGQKPITFFRQVLALAEYPQVCTRFPVHLLATKCTCTRLWKLHSIQIVDALAALSMLSLPCSC